jgi:hypothetical protein
MLPGGRFLYHAQSDRPENSGVFEASLANPGERRRLLNTSTNALYSPGGNGNGYLLWLRSGSLVAQGLDADAFKLAGEPHPIAGPIGRSVGFSLMNVAVSARELIFGSSDVLSQLTWLDRTGNPLGVVGEPAEYLTSRLSPDERHIVAVRSSVGVRDLWLLEVGRGLSSRFTSNGIHKYPIWSPDGKIIVFGSGTPYNLYRKEASGAGNEQRLTNGPNLQGATDWSRDGRWILYTENGPDTQKDLWVLPMTAAGTIPEGAKPRSYLRTPANESGGRFSPEQSPRWIAYQSDESGRNEVYVRAFPEPHGKFQISTAGGSYAQWGESGRELFYVSPTNRLMAVRLELGSDSVEPSAPRELFQLPSVDYYADRPYEVTADGRRFLVVAPLHSLQPLTVIVNWPALLKKSASQ